jgi:predicted transcriptional regulator
MSEKQAKFLELAKKQERLKEIQDEVRTELNSVMTELGYGTTLQDPTTLAVYKIVKPNGTFTYYRDVDYVRTALEGERAGTLSKKEAESLGFVLK